MRSNATIPTHSPRSTRPRSSISIRCARTSSATPVTSVPRSATCCLIECITTSPSTASTARSSALVGAIDRSNPTRKSSVFSRRQASPKNVSSASIARRLTKHSTSSNSAREQSTTSMNASTSAKPRSMKNARKHACRAQRPSRTQRRARSGGVARGDRRPRTAYRRPHRVLPRQRVRLAVLSDQH